MGVSNCNNMAIWKLFIRALIPSHVVNFKPIIHTNTSIARYDSLGIQLYPDNTIDDLSTIVIKLWIIHLISPLYEILGTVD
mgnify:CR=1 FL=1